MALPNRLRDIPADFASHAPMETIIELRHRYTAGTDTILRWIRQCGVDRNRKPHDRALLQAPADFAQFARVEYRFLLEKRFGVTNKVITRWLAEAGLVPVAWRPSGIEPKPKSARKAETASRPRKAPSNLSQMGRRPEPMMSRPVRSLHEEARDHLATELRCPVYRCDERTGTPNQKGFFWRVGQVVYTPADMLAYAKRKGFGKPFELAA